MTHDESSQQQHEEGGEAQTMSLLSGVARADGLPDAEAAEFESQGINKPSQTTLIMVGVALVAGGMLWFMRPSPSAASDSENPQAAAKVEQVLVELSNPDAMSKDSAVAPGNLQALFADTEAVISMLSTDYTSQQVPVRFVKKNPFRLDRAGGETPTGPTEAARQRREKLKKLNQEFDRMELQSVMGGRTPIVLIDGEMYRVGDEVGSFKIESIDERSLAVKLVAMGETFTLSMQQASGGR